MFDTLKSTIKKIVRKPSEGDEKRVNDLRFMNRKQRRTYYKLNHKRLGWPDWDTVNGSN